MSKKRAEMDRQTLSKLISDEYTGRILAATYNSPKTAKRIAKQCNIPIAICFRRIRELEKIGLLICAGVVYDRQGKGAKLYQSQLNGAYIYLSNDRIRGHFKLASGTSLSKNPMGS